MSSNHKRRRKHPAFKRRTSPGAMPGLVVSDPAAAETSIRLFQYSATNVVEREVTAATDLRQFVKPGSVLWVDVDGLGNAETLRQVGETFKLHPLALEDVVHTHQRAKVEGYDHILYVVVRMYSSGQPHQSEQLSMFLGPHWVVTFQERGGDCFDQIRERLRTDKGRIRKCGADYLVYALIDAVVDGYFPVLDKFAIQLDELEDRMALGTRNSPLRMLHDVRRDLREFRRVLWPHRDAINALLRDGIEELQPETRISLRDCYDHVVQLVEVTETLRETCTDLRELHLAELGQRTNDVTKVLTVIAVLFMPMSFIAALYGMNFDPNVSSWNMPELRWVFGYPFALSLMATMEIGLLTYLWRRGWLQRTDVFIEPEEPEA